MPNTKTKKFDWQIFLAVFCILLVICCATVCCVIANTDNGVARAYTEEEIGVTNLQFSVNDGFYVKNLSTDDFDKLFDYLSYYYAGTRNSETVFISEFDAGYLQMTYNGGSISQKVPLEVNIGQYSLANYNIISIQVLVNGYDNAYLFNYMHAYNTDLFAFDSSFPYTQVANDYYFTFQDNPSTSGTFANEIIIAVLGSDQVQNVSSIDSLSFTFDNTSNLGCVISPNHTFATPPVVMPEGVYNQNLQNSYNEGGFFAQQTINELQQSNDELQAEINRLTGIIQEQRQEIQYYESLNLNMTAIPIFTIARCSPSTFEYNGVTYTSDTIERTSSGWDIYHSSYLNQELPENYGVGFSLFLVETLSNTKFDMSPLIDCWYRYTYDGGEAIARYMDFSVGYRNQNGNIVKVGSFATGPGMSDGEFVIDAPTNELVFFRDESNLMEVDDGFSIVRYQYDLESIYNDAYDDGIKMGIQLGRQEGYNQGVLDANDYSFFSLFTSVFDAPITAIVGKWGDSDGDGIYQREGGMLNFYIPGLDINFAPFLLSLFTIGIIVLIIRFILARKS